MALLLTDDSLTGLKAQSPSTSSGAVAVEAEMDVGREVRVEIFFKQTQRSHVPILDRNNGYAEAPASHTQQTVAISGFSAGQDRASDKIHRQRVNPEKCIFPKDHPEFQEIPGFTQFSPSLGQYPSSNTIRARDIVILRRVRVERQRSGRELKYVRWCD